MHQADAREARTAKAYLKALDVNRDVGKLGHLGEQGTVRERVRSDAG
jgi:hypothetical protein